MPNEQLTIIKNLGAYREYPFEAIPSAALARISEAASNFPIYVHPRVPVALRALECFLQVTGQQLPGTVLSKECGERLCRRVIGAVYSPRFITLTNSRAYEISYTLRAIFASLCDKSEEREFLGDLTSTLGATSEVSELARVFESERLIPEKVWLWRGWPTTNRRGSTVWLPLIHVYLKLGRQFTSDLYEQCDTYFRARKNSSVLGLNALTTFIGQSPTSLRPKDLTNPYFMNRFWREYFCHYMITEFNDGNKQRISTLVIAWRRHITHFINDFLIGSGLFAAPMGELPSPEPKTVTGANTRITVTEDGVEVKTKLLTDIPLRVPDDEAIELLFHRIEADFESVVNWAKAEVHTIWARHQQRIRMADHSQTQSPFCGSSELDQSRLTGVENAARLQQAAAIYAAHGHVTDDDVRVGQLFPGPLTQTAEELGLPVADTLYAHCVLLAARHPIITPSYMSELELYNKDGKKVGLQKIDACWYLVGNKARKGAALAQQHILLTDEAKEIIEQVIALTTPLRDYLKSRNDDNWRYLLLTSGKGFGYPRRIRLGRGLARHRTAKIAQAIHAASGMPLDHCTDLANRITISTVRASAGVLVYLKTGSVEKMAEALGHTEYSNTLIAHYLPEPLLAFFRDRWIRIFQTGIIVEALRDSPYLLEASGFESMAELHQFLTNHALKTIPADVEYEASTEGDSYDGTQTCARSEIVFGLNETILVLLLSLELAVKDASHDVGAKAKYWAGITGRLTKYIESDLCARTDLKEYVSKARLNADARTMEALLYA